MAVKRPQGAKLTLGQPLGELAERGGAVVSGELRGHRNGHDGGERVTPPARAAELGHSAKTLPQASKPSRGPRSGVAFALPVRSVVEAAQLLARVAGQRIDQDLLRMAVGDPGGRRAGLAGKATGLPQRLPVRRAVARAGEPASVHERLGDQNWMPMHRAEIVGHPAKTQPQHPRGQVRRATSGQDDEPSVVGDEVGVARSERRNCCSGSHPIHRSRAFSLNAPACQPMSASQCSPSTATWRTLRPTSPRNGK